MQNRCPRFLFNIELWGSGGEDRAIIIPSRTGVSFANACSKVSVFGHAYSTGKHIAPAWLQRFQHTIIVLRLVVMIPMTRIRTSNVDDYTISNDGGDDDDDNTNYDTILYIILYYTILYLNVLFDTIHIYIYMYVYIYIYAHK